MGLLILTIVVMVLLIVIIILNNRYFLIDLVNGILESILFLMGIFLLAFIITLSSLKIEHKNFIIRSRELHELLENIEDKNINISLEELIEHNVLIEEHRRFIDNIWISQWYSKDIAELELLDLKNIGKSKDGE